MAKSDNAVYLERWREQQREEALKRVHEVLTSAASAGTSVSFSGIARQAKVSRSWLYESPYADEIRSLREIAPVAVRSPAENASVASLKRRLSDALDDNKRLRAENQELSRQLSNALGKARTG